MLRFSNVIQLDVLKHSIRPLVLFQKLSCLPNYRHPMSKIANLVQGSHGVSEKNKDGAMSQSCYLDQEILSL
jgi:hypothetical protein